MPLTPVKQTLKTLLLPPYCHWRYGDLGKYMVQARLIEGWTTFDELEALAETCQTLPDNPVVVEIGSFLGRSAIMLAGCCKLRGNGQVHCIDPLDGSGDSFSVPVYKSIANTLSTSLQDRFVANIKRAGVENWVTLHKGTAETIAQNWSNPIDLLFLDGDQSPAGVQTAYQSWIPFLKPQGILAVHNSTGHNEGHDGHSRLVREQIKLPQYEFQRCVDTTTFAQKQF